MSSQEPSKADIDAILKRLRSISTNKVKELDVQYDNDVFNFL